MQQFQQLLREIDELHTVYIAKRPLSDEERAARYEELRIKWTYNSNAIEGNSLTLGETAFYLREGLTSEGKPLIDYLEARNHAEAIDWLKSLTDKNKPITEGIIKDLNALLHKGITERPAMGADGKQVMRQIHPGMYKTQPNHVITLSGEIHYYVEPLQVPGEMEKLARTIAAEERAMHPVELSALVHYEISRIHPFDDCNGRGARLLMNLILMRSDFPPIVIKMEERRRYLETLEAADKGEREPFYIFIAEHIKQALA
jgi:Fic family protein